MKSIYTLIPDIYALVKTRGWMTDESAAILGEEVSRRIQSQFNYEREGSLRMSKLGPQCPCALWYSVNKPELAEPLPPNAEIKYAYGHLIEALIISLAKSAGHRVEGEQDELTLDGVVGHRDCVIDGCIVDVKSSSSIGFRKFKDKTISTDDSFGYLDQLDAYLVASYDDPLVTVKDRAYLLVIDKQLGHMVLYEHRLREENIRQRIEESKSIVGLSSPPKCRCGTVADGKSGNIKLDTKASYNSFKYCCNPTLRTFLYSNGPVYLTKVVRVPDVPEIRPNRLGVSVSTSSTSLSKEDEGINQDGTGLFRTVPSLGQHIH